MSVTVSNPDGTTTTLSDGDFAATNVAYTAAQLFAVYTANLDRRKAEVRAAFTWFGLAIPLTIEKLSELHRLDVMLTKSAIGFWTYVKATGAADTGVHTTGWTEGDGTPVRYYIGNGVYADSPGFTPGNATDLNLSAHRYDFAVDNRAAVIQAALKAAYDANDTAALDTAWAGNTSGWPTGT